MHQSVLPKLSRKDVQIVFLINLYELVIDGAQNLVKLIGPFLNIRRDDFNKFNEPYISFFFELQPENPS